MVERSLSMREVPGSIPGASTTFLCPFNYFMYAKGKVKGEKRKRKGGEKKQENNHQLTINQVGNECSNACIYLNIDTVNSL